MMKFFHKIALAHKRPSISSSEDSNPTVKPAKKLFKFKSKRSKKVGQATTALSPESSQLKAEHPDSSQPEADSPQSSRPKSQNPSLDERPLPVGWIRRWDEGQKRFFYLDTEAPGGPKPHWIYPADLVEAQTGRSPPPGPPPTQQQEALPQPQYYYPAQEPITIGFFDPVSSQAGSSQTGAGQQRRRSRGGFSPLVAGAGGMAGGMSLGLMIEDRHHDYEEAYKRGYERGYENGEWFGDDFGGGHMMDGGFF